MLKPISKTEKADILLTLALAFEKKMSESGEERTVKTVAELTEKYFAAYPSDDAKKVRARSEYFDRLPPEKRNVWQKSRLEKKSFATSPMTRARVLCTARRRSGAKEFASASRLQARVRL